MNYILQAQVDVKVEIWFTIFCSNAAEKRCDLHWPIKSVLVILPCCDIIKPDPDMICSTQSFHCTKSYVFLFAEIEQSGHNFFSAVDADDVSIVEFSVIHRIAPSGIACFQTVIHTDYTRFPNR